MSLQLARLDTCVTVVDAANLLLNMASIETVAVSCCTSGKEQMQEEKKKQKWMFSGRGSPFHRSQGTAAGALHAALGLHAG